MPLKIYRRKGSDVYQYRGTLAGCRLRGSTRTADKATAARIASQVENEFYKRRLDGPQEVLTFPKATALYLAAGKPERFIAKLVKHWGNIKVIDITTGAIKQAALEIYPKAATATRNRQVIVPTQAIINHAAELGLCPHIVKLKRPKVDTKIKKPVTLEWISAFMAHATRPDVASLAMFMFATGARISEALAVEWKDIDFKARTVLIKQTKLGNERVAHMPIKLTIALGNLPERNKKTKPFAFAGHTSALKAWMNTIERAMIEPLTFHSCRHGFATGLLHRGVDPITVAKLGGWKSAQHVFQTYGHAQGDTTLTNRLFDTEADTVSKPTKTNQDVS